MKLTSAVRKLVVLAAALSLSAAAAVTSFASTRLDTVSDTYWDDDDKTTATWEEVEDVYRYEVYLYCDESKVAEIKTKKNKYNFEKKMTKAGDYTFRVRALAKGSDYRDGAWSDYSDTMYIDEDFAELMKNGGVIDTKNSGPGAQNHDAAAATSSTTWLTGASFPIFLSSEGWVQDEAGRWRFKSECAFQLEPKGDYLTNCCLCDTDGENPVWYFFDDQGYMATGWVNMDGLYFYCDASGAMQRGWVDWNGQRYYCNENGAMVTGSYTIDGVTYQFDDSGALQQ